MSLMRPSLLAGKRCLATRGYATQAGKAGSKSAESAGLPLLLGTAGVIGLAGYVYLQRNPGAQSPLAKASKDKVKHFQAEIKASEESPAAAGALIKDIWTPFTLTKVEPYNHNTNIYTFYFGDEAKDKTRGGEVAHAILLKSPEGPNEVMDDKGKPVIRPYTPTSPPDEKGYIQLIIKQYKDGKLTPYMATLKPGKDTMLFKGPIPKFTYQPNSFDRGLCIAGGSGITPMWQLINHSLTLPEDKTKWTLLFSNVSEADILMRKEWEDLAHRHPGRLELKFVLDKPPRNWGGETGFITPSMISKVFPRGEDRSRVFVCGPPPQVKSLAGPKDGPRQGELQGALKELGYSSDEVFKY